MHVSRVLRKTAVLVLASLMLAGAKPAKLQPHLAAAMFSTARWPYLPGSILPLRIDGITVPYHIAVLGIGQLVQNSNAYSVPFDGYRRIGTLDRRQRPCSRYKEAADRVCAAR